MANKANTNHPSVMSAGIMFRPLTTAAEYEEFRQWARDNYAPGSPIKSIWHPVVRAECEEMNRVATKHPFNPPMSTIYGLGRRCLDCGEFEAAHA